MSIKRLSECDSPGMVDDESGDYVYYEDHVLSHSFEESKEGALFEAFLMNYWLPILMGYGMDESAINNQKIVMWEAWKACAESRVIKVGDTK